MTILVTGTAGFIGYSLAEALLQRGETVTGFDNFNPYYDPSIKEARTARLARHPGFTLVRGDLADQPALAAAFEAAKPDRVVNLAAQAGVRYSIEHPEVYVASNLVGFCNILELCKQHEVGHLVYASTSSVYGKSDAVRFSEEHRTDAPLSIYAATKKSNEVLAYSYAHLFGLKMSGLRFFTVYGPWGRPDMALFMFTRNILAGKPGCGQRQVHQVPARFLRKVPMHRSLFPAFQVAGCHLQGLVPQALELGRANGQGRRAGGGI